MGPPDGRAQAQDSGAIGAAHNSIKVFAILALRRRQPLGPGESPKHGVENHNVTLPPCGGPLAELTTNLVECAVELVEGHERPCFDRLSGDDYVR